MAALGAAKRKREGRMGGASAAWSEKRIGSIKATTPPPTSRRLLLSRMLKHRIASHNHHRVRGPTETPTPRAKLVAGSLPSQDGHCLQAGPSKLGWSAWWTAGVGL
eukprot:1560260-Rhodomonas_salina.4